MMRGKTGILIGLAASILAITTPMPALARVVAYSGPASEKLFIEDAPTLGKTACFAQFEGVESSWSGKVIRVERRTTAGGAERYSFTYEEELSSGKRKTTYDLIVETGQTLVHGSLAKTVKLHFPEGQGNPPELTYDATLSKESQKLGLRARHEKSPYTPEVD